MNNTNRKAASSGKGFYVALSLCVAMVGAACFYAYQRTEVPKQVQPDYAVTLTTPTTAHTTRTTTQTTSAVPMTSATPDAEEAAAIIRRTTTTTTVSEPPATTPAPVEKAVFPVDGEVFQPFSGRELVKSPTTGVWQTHNGMDIAAPLGTNVVCVLDGTVSAVENDALMGVCVSVLHADGTVTRYCNLSEGVSVFAGENLERGTVIGTIGATAEAESTLDAHLHFEVLQNDCYTDPMAFLSRE